MTLYSIWMPASLHFAKNNIDLEGHGGGWWYDFFPSASDCISLPLFLPVLSAYISPPCCFHFCSSGLWPTADTRGGQKKGLIRQHEPVSYLWPLLVLYYVLYIIYHISYIYYIIYHISYIIFICTYHLSLRRLATRSPIFQWQPLWFPWSPLGNPPGSSSCTHKHGHVMVTYGDNMWKMIYGCV